MKTNGSRIREIALAAMFAAITAVLAFITIPLPFSPVPISGQTLGVMLAGLLLGSRGAAISQMLYLFLGAVGLPIFAGGSSGIGALFGPTGGYLWGFVVGAYVIGKVIEGREEVGLGWKIFALVVGGIAVVYILGLAQLMYVTEMSLSKAVAVGALPFLIGDGFKVVVVALVAQKINMRALVQAPGRPQAK